MTDPYLLLWLEAPLQSWGYDSKFGRRHSLDFPTKSALLGLICCARGAGGEEKDWLELWSNLDLQIKAYVPADKKGLPVSRQPLLSDFQMVGSGYDSDDKWESLLIPKTQKGKKAVGGGTKITYRYYLQDLAFAVAMQAPVSLAQSVVQALEAPVWDLYLGRKSCVPTDFISRGLFESADSALNESIRIASDKNRVCDFNVLQGIHEGEVFTINDVPVQFGKMKKYRDRQVTIQKSIYND